MNISVLLLTLNEEQNLPACLSAVSWSDDLVVLDSFSQDDTASIAGRHGARVYRRAFDNFAEQRNYALEHIDFKNDWILHLDADEIVTPELHTEISSLTGSDSYDAYRIPSKMMFFGRWLRHSGLYPSYQVRLGHRKRFRFKQVGHGQREDLNPERIGTLRSPYLHYSFSKGLTEWLEKHNRYATDEALETVRVLSGTKGVDWSSLFTTDPTRRRRALKELALRLPFRPLLRFLYMYVLRLGFLDGWAGLTYCRLLSIYEYLIVLKTRELMARQGSSPSVDGRPNWPGK